MVGTDHHRTGRLPNVVSELPPKAAVIPDGPSELETHRK
jgi:hypothetical protein